MSLRRSPTRTAALLAANRSNAKKSTGPKTDRGKGFSQLNSLKHGRYARMFRSNLLRARRDPQLYDWLYAAIRDALGASTARQRQVADEIARGLWCFLTGWKEPRPLGAPPVEHTVWALHWTPRRHGSWGAVPSTAPTLSKCRRGCRFRFGCRCRAAAI